MRLKTRITMALLGGAMGLMVFASPALANSSSIQSSTSAAKAEWSGWCGGPATSGPAMLNNLKKYNIRPQLEAYYQISKDNESLETRFADFQLATLSRPMMQTDNKGCNPGVLFDSQNRTKAAGDMMFVEGRALRALFPDGYSLTAKSGYLRKQVFLDTQGQPNCSNPGRGKGWFWVWTSVNKEVLPTGQKGPKGDKGDTGPQGPPGPAGKDGKDGKAIVVKSPVKTKPAKSKTPPVCTGIKVQQAGLLIRGEATVTGATGPFATYWNWGDKSYWGVPPQAGLSASHTYVAGNGYKVSATVQFQNGKKLVKLACGTRLVLVEAPATSTPPPTPKPVPAPTPQPQPAPTTGGGGGGGGGGAAAAAAVAGTTSNTTSSNSSNTSNTSTTAASAAAGGGGGGGGGSNGGGGGGGGGAAAAVAVATTTVIVQPAPVQPTAVLSVQTINDIPAGQCRPVTINVIASAPGTLVVSPSKGSINQDCYSPTTRQSMLSFAVPAGSSSIVVAVWAPSDASVSSDTLTATVTIPGMNNPVVSTQTYAIKSVVRT